MLVSCKDETGTEPIDFPYGITSYKAIQLPNTVESWLYVQVGTQKFGRRTERDVQYK